MSGESATDAFLAQMRERAAKLRSIQAASPASAPPVVDAYQQAAAVLHVFDPCTLRPASSEAAASGEASPGLITASVPAVGFRGRGLRTLPSPVRVAALAALGSRSAMRAALTANPDRELTGVQRLFEIWLNEEAFDLGRMRFTELEYLRQLYEWGLERFGDLPDRATDDLWQVVGLHRGSKFVRGVKFQGNDVAYLNVGTQITAILEHLRSTHAGQLPELGI